MNVLLAARDLSGIGGVQSWVRTVAAEFKRRGHRVVATDLAGEERDRTPGYDLGIFAHGAETRDWFGLCERSLLVSHGIIELERPVPGADAYAFVSEECCDLWSHLAGPAGNLELVWRDAPIIRQPIDCEFWSPGQPEVRTERPYIYRHSYYGGLDFLPSLCDELGYSFYHGKQSSPEIARDMIRGAACVISSGRGALEAMACGVPTLIADHRPYAGPAVSLPDHDMEEDAACNYSGRGPLCRIQLESSDLTYVMAGKGEAFRRYVLDNHAAPMIVDQLLEAAGLPLGQEEELAIAPI